MNFVATETLNLTALETFFEKQWETIEDKATLHQDGFFVEEDGEYKAYFSLSPVDNGGYWLKSLYMKEGAPTTYPLAIIESSIALAREKGGKELYVFSHQSALNSLLSLLQFKQQEEPSFAGDSIYANGTWWKVILHQSTHQSTKVVDNQ
ncbi:hypothetical protein [Aquibacillus salsiterrae]|uniref:Uncharacterized protein n=1 Tax=Aquibacillus salsiterrae TaxID=2950439 RepID=A0A9X3WDJ7_9BACI|nr:hypothetical protein [Aquibacillus salsiterrae]MDC3416748.1 hypothetical protein [Aquibacillus salsiterrae]